MEAADDDDGDDNDDDDHDDGDGINGDGERDDHADESLFVIDKMALWEREIDK